MQRFLYTDSVGVVTSVIDAAEKNPSKNIDPDFKHYVASFILKHFPVCLLIGKKIEISTTEIVQIFKCCHVRCTSFFATQTYTTQLLTSPAFFEIKCKRRRRSDALAHLIILTAVP